MKRLDSLPDEQLPAFLDRLESDQREMKAALQRVGGASVQSVLSQSAGTYDWSGVLPTDPTVGAGTGYRLLKVTATAQNMDDLYGTLITYLYVGTTTNWYRPSNYLLDVEAGHPAFNHNVLTYIVNVADRKQRAWMVQLTGDDSTTLYLKYYLVASDSVTFTTSVLV